MILIAFALILLSFQVDRIKHTIANTTQFFCVDTCLLLHKHLKSRFPAINVSYHNETVATDAFFFDMIPSLDDGVMGHGGTCTTCLHLYCGFTSLLTAVYPMKTG